MAMPDYQSVLMPLLKIAGDGQTHKFSDACDFLAQHFNISTEELKELLPSGKYPKFKSRVGWAKTYLNKAGLIEYPNRGTFAITQRGQDVLNSGIEKIDNAFLQQYPEFLEFVKGSTSKDDNDGGTVPDKLTPDERLETAYQELQASLAMDLLKQTKKCTPLFFERLVIDLLVSMGYGGSIEDAGEVIGKSGDEGIDGIIKEDCLGFGIVYVQAKKWDDTNPISRPEIQKFVGALQGKNAQKGVYITTGKFSAPAKEFVKNLKSKIVLIDGNQLAQYMIDFNVGVSRKQIYEVKKIDMDYFFDE